MHGDAVRLIKYMEGSSKRFIIPVYQRNYDWKIEQCKQLFDDLEKLIKNGRKNHFFGSIVASLDDEGSLDEHLIIDGQQRLTTISLLFLAMYHLLESGEVEAEDIHLKEKILKKYLIDEFEPKETRMKLKPIKDDRKAFSCLFDEDGQMIPDSSLTVNYEYFKKRIVSTSLTIDELYEAMSKLIVINISLNRDDDPQLIFESLNSTGLNLSEGDKIRNYVLMGLPKSMQELHYEKYWNKIEKNSDYEVDLFVRDYLSVKRLRTPNMRKVYISFKEYMEELGEIDVEEVLKDLLEYSKRYRILIHGTGEHDNLDRVIYRLNRLETSVTRPYLLEVLRNYEDGNIDKTEMTKIFSIVENYIARRMVCDIPTNALNKIFVALNNEIVSLSKNKDQYVKKLIFILINKSESGRFPTDQEFMDCISNKNVYSMRAKNKKYLLDRFENYGTLETKDIWNHLDNGNYSIEHIMPQSLSPTWKDELIRDGDPKEIHDKWLHKLANLTLTAYNSKYSNSSFEEKRDREDGFKKSGIRMNSWVSQQQRWGIKELEERNSLLLKQAKDIWWYPETDYVPQKNIDDFLTLDSDEDMTGKQIVRFTFNGVSEAVTTWVDMYERVLMMLHVKDKSVLRKITYSSSKEQPFISFDTREEGFNSKREIDTDIYVWTGNNTETKLNVLRMLFPLYDEESRDLVFYIRGM